MSTEKSFSSEHLPTTGPVSNKGPELELNSLTLASKAELTRLTKIHYQRLAKQSRSFSRVKRRKFHDPDFKLTIKDFVDATVCSDAHPKFGWKLGGSLYLKKLAAKNIIFTNTPY